MICDMCNKDVNNDKIIHGKTHIVYIDKDGMEKEVEKDAAICIECLADLSKHVDIPITIDFEGEND